MVVSLWLKLKRKGSHRPGKRFEVELLKQAERQADYVESTGKWTGWRGKHGGEM